MGSWQRTYKFQQVFSNLVTEYNGDYTRATEEWIKLFHSIRSYPSSEDHEDDDHDEQKAHSEGVEDVGNVLHRHSGISDLDFKIYGRTANQITASLLTFTILGANLLILQLKKIKVSIKWL